VRLKAVQYILEINSSRLKSGTIVAGDQAVMRAKDMNENSCFMNINAIKAVSFGLFRLLSRMHLYMHLGCSLQSRVKYERAARDLFHI
jgi:hypothetical protein